MKRLVATYKAHRGGELFDASIRSIADSVDGIVVALSERSWDNNGLPNNCREVVESWQSQRPGWFHSLWIESTKSSDQDEAALACVREKYGDDTAVLVIDTDEIWEPTQVGSLRLAINDHPERHYFTANLFSYLKDPRYQVYPQEIHRPVVGLRNAKPQPTSSRYYAKTAGRTHHCHDISFHHFTYVRADEAEIPRKFHAISTQEITPSNPRWLDTVWPNLPEGTNLHMTPGFEVCWRSIKVLPAPAIAVPDFCSAIMAKEDARWLERMATTPPDRTIVPVPAHRDAAKYQEFARLAPNVSLLRQGLKMTFLEALVLSQFARRVPDHGSIIEIGSGSGGSMAVMALSAPTAALWAVDPFTPYDETNITTVHGVCEGNEAQFWDMATHYGYRSRLSHVRATSDVAAQQFTSECADLVFVDGNHTYDVCKRDIASYWPFVKRGGVMLVHDVSTRFPGVVKAVQESGLPFRAAVGTTLGYARK